MYKIIFLLFLATVNCQNADGEDLDSIISGIFGNQPKGDTNYNPGNTIATQPPVIESSNTNPTVHQEISCTRRDGSVGECVTYYLCDATDITEDGVGLIDLGGMDSTCPSYLDTCCRVEDKKPVQDPIKPITEPKM